MGIQALRDEDNLLFLNQQNQVIENEHVSICRNMYDSCMIQYSMNMLEFVRMFKQVVL